MGILGASGGFTSVPGGLKDFISVVGVLHKGSKGLEGFSRSFSCISWASRSFRGLQGRSMG